MILRKVGALAESGARRRAPPLADVLTIEWWDPTQLAPGAVSLFAGRKRGASYTADGAARPVASATALGGFPGLTADGVANIMACSSLGPTMATLGAVTWTGAVITTGAAAQQLWEHTINSATQAGGAGVSLDASLGRLFGAVRTTLRGLAYGAQALTGTPHVISLGLDTSVPAGVRFIRHNGVALALTPVISSATPGLFANAPMHLFARSGPVGGTLFAGALGDHSLRAGVAEDAMLERIERFYGARCGLSW